MKKVILALAIVSVSFAACNNGEDKKVEETTTKDTMTVITPVSADTVKVIKDSIVKTTVTTDTMKKKK